VTYDYATGIRPDEEPKRTQPYMDYDPPAPYEPCPRCAAHYAREIDRWQRIAYGLADADDMHRRNTEQLTRDLAETRQANAALRRQAERARHYDDPPEGDAA
jgi:hypothetical protein